MMNDTAKGVLVRGINKNQIEKINLFKNNIIDGKFQILKW